MVESLPPGIARRARRLLLRTLTTAIAWSLVSYGSMAGARGPRESCWLRPQDSIWLVSTRHMGCVSNEDATRPMLRLWQYDHGSGWMPSTVDAFVSTDDANEITSVYLHGNRVASQEATAGGLTLYRLLVRNAPEQARVRYVIWSWPSAKTSRPLQQLHEKAGRTLSEGYYLGWFLSRIQREVRISLIGYSYGPRIMTGAMHLLGGGSVAGWSLPVEPAENQQRLRVVAFAAAVDNDVLLPGHYHGKAMSTVDHMLLCYNPIDPVLKRYHVVSKRRHASALGRTGLACPQRLGEAAARVDQINVASTIGRTHDWDAYTCSSSLIHEMGRCALWD